MPELTGPPTGSVVGVTLYNVTATHTRGTVRTARAVVAESGTTAEPRWETPWDGTTVEYQWDATTGGVTVYAAPERRYANAAAVPLGYTRLTSAVYGELLPGTVLDAYLSTDTARLSPVADPPGVAAVNGTWSLDVPTGDSYALMGRLPNRATTVQVVTV